LAKHKNLEMENPEKAIRGFVMLRSMVARENLIVAYGEGNIKRCLLSVFCCKNKIYRTRMYLNY
jgi:hypothetical protein